MSRVQNLEDNINIVKELKLKSGGHSPAPKEIEGALGFNPIKHDHCFLSNPYATNIVIDELEKSIDREFLFEILEAYPAGQDYVAPRLARAENLNEENMIVTNGAIQSIDWVLDKWSFSKLCIPLPTFSSYYEFLDKDRYEIVSTKNVWTIDSLLDATRNSNSDALLLINPNNPDGKSYDPRELKYLIENLNGLKLIIDESFYHFLDFYDEYIKFRSTIVNKDVVFIKSFSKDYGIAGLRLGYLYSTDKELLESIKSHTTWNLNNLSVWFSNIISTERFMSLYSKARLQYLSDRKFFYNELLKIKDIVVYPSQGNFFLIKLPNYLDDNFVFKLLIKYGLYIRTMEDKLGLGPEWVRVASRTKEENMNFVNILQKELSHT